MVEGFEQLGPTFVKLGQLIALRPACSPRRWPTPACGPWTRSRPFDSARWRRLVTEELGRPPEEIFRSFDDQPLSAASIAQVHAVVLHDGGDAVIKLQRPDIGRTG